MVHLVLDVRGETVTYTFSSSQKAAYDAVQKGENVFISGSGGNGKSFLTRKLTTNRTAVAAPTGIAAINVNGTTCHRLFGLPFGLPETKDWNMVSRKSALALNAVDRVIISEVGMVRVDQLDLIDKKLKLVKGNNKPFGGVQMIVEGDFFQLEPVVGQSEYNRFYEQYDNPFAFASKAWKFTTHELTEPQRHPKIEQYNLLNKVRIGDTEALQELLDISKPYTLSDTTLHLCARNSDAARVNHHWYGMNSNKEHLFTASITGKMSEKEVIVPEKLLLKVGCKVLICANDLGGQYVNGNSGVVLALSNHSIKVELDTGLVVEVERFTWEQYSYTGKGKNLVKEVVGSFTQFPLSLGWAVTIHKSQGMTLDSAAIHVGEGCFAHGQFYVAASRVRDLSNLSFLRKQNVTKDNLIVRKEVLEFYGR
jgi:ATP-dependent DNA helicase PIF1